MKGVIERETAKALLIKFGEENGQWNPKFTIHSNYSTEKGIETKVKINIKYGKREKKSTIK